MRLHLPHIGFRKLKSVLAVFIAFWFWQFVRLFFPDLEIHPIFIYIYSMIEIRDSSQKTLTMGRGRIKATFIGLGVGMPILGLSEIARTRLQEEWILTAIQIALLLLGILLTLIVAEEAKCGPMCGLAAVIFIVLIAAHANDERYVYAMIRAVQTIAGVFIAWLINVKWFPYDGKTDNVPVSGLKKGK